jgi:hypothetical protein
MEKEKSIGALWEKTGGKGKWMSGSLELDGKVIRIVCFTNGYKKEAKHPDWKIYLSRERGGENSPSTSPKTAPRSEETAESGAEDVDPNEIPF